MPCTAVYARLPGSATLERSIGKTAVSAAAANGPSGALKVALGHCGIHWVGCCLLIAILDADCHCLPVCLDLPPIEN